MADAIEVAIESALTGHLRNLTLSPVLTISLPNVGTPPSRTFSPPTAASGASYLRATFLPASSFALALGYDSSNQHYGIFQVDVFAYLGDGEIAPARTAAAIIAWFARGTKLPTSAPILQIGVGSNIPRRGQMLTVDPWVMIPVSIPYLAFANPA